ncbi:hypothetical protein AAAC13_07160 [Pseudomonas aeruginosa]|nr:hypothetical protein [Pseudomonas aeruginosa]MDF5922004.1 hypothetical protein [Pseudomonas aeruginosa]MDF5924601.1 hypothetical protein [Pseudomonas aeruginosa]MDF5947207.1 hypothetical protein [Pseudomonas aeruginosa]MDF5989330.1 hypothetical protein [Pseudomonas aeruginosa]
MNIRCPLFLEKPARLASLFAVLDPKCVIARMLRQKTVQIVAHIAGKPRRA